MPSLAARCLMIGFAGPTADQAFRRWLRETGFGGVILFQRNVIDLPQVAELNRALRASVAAPLLIGVDQEGGRVARLPPPLLTLPAMRQLGRTGDHRLTFQAARALGQELRELGFNVNFAPVLDVDSNPANPIIGDRSFGRDRAVVIRHGLAFIRGLQAAPIAACGKHFPGHGDTATDSHLARPVVSRPRGALEQLELAPFAAAVHAGAAALMTAHVDYPALDPRAPATLSPAMITGLLRQRWGFNGAVVSDDLEMQSITASLPPPEAAVLALRAGVDLVLLCHSPAFQEAAIVAIEKAVAAGRLPPARLAEAARRVALLAHRYAIAGMPRRFRFIGSETHRLLEQRIRRAAISPPRG